MRRILYLFTPTAIIMIGTEVFFKRIKRISVPTEVKVWLWLFSFGVMFTTGIFIGGNISKKQIVSNITILEPITTYGL